MLTQEKLFKELESQVRIDREALDDEVIRFPEIFYHVCKNARLAEDSVNDLRVIRNEIELELQEKARDVLTTEGGRVTNARISAWVKRKVRYRGADRKYQIAKSVHGKWFALKEAMQAKSYKLRDLVDLYIAQYYSDPSSSDGSTNKRRRAIRLASSKRG